MPAPRRSYTTLLVILAAACGGGERHPTDIGQPAGPRIDRVSGDAQAALGGELLPSPLIVRVTDNGLPLAGAVVSFTAAAGQLSASGFVTGADGIAQVTWTLPSDTVGLGRAPVVARLATSPRDSVVFHARGLAASESDLVLANVRTPVTLLLYHSGAFTATSVATRELRDSMHLSRASIARWSEIAAFVPGMAPRLAVRAARAGRDTVRLDFQATVIRIPLTVWVVEPPFDSTVQLVETHLAAVRATWEALGGIGLRDVRVVDATTDPRFAHLRGRMAGQCLATTPAEVGHDAGRLNAYYLGVAPIGSAGYCGDGRMEIYPLAWERSAVVLAHEIGHGFLGGHHETVPDNVMHFRGDGTRFTPGQLFRAHFSSWSTMNTMFGAHPPASRRECAVAPNATAPVCPPTSWVF